MLYSSDWLQGLFATVLSDTAKTARREIGEPSTINAMIRTARVYDGRSDNLSCRELAGVGRVVVAVAARNRFEATLN